HAGGLVRIPQDGTVIIEDDVEIGANTTIDRATMGATLVRRGVKLDNLVQIGPNCEVGEFSRFSGQVGLAGSVKAGKWCQFGGQVGVSDHVKIGDRAIAVGQTGIHGEVKSDAIVGGAPQVEFSKYRRYAVALPRIPEMLRRIRAIERHLGLRNGASSAPG
ncbi:MAG: UDP-3-O-(3-hydroxymyristoyl)glucosamine N-acyltransferase, partial [Candidatus Binataceae bacterium]